MHGYDCVKDYYDNYLFGRSPQDVARKRADEDRTWAEQQRKTSEEMQRHRELYGD